VTEVPLVPEAGAIPDRVGTAAFTVKLIGELVPPAVVTVRGCDPGVASGSMVSVTVMDVEL
jgi:hypothetical protein